MLGATGQPKVCTDRWILPIVTPFYKSSDTILWLGVQCKEVYKGNRIAGRNMFIISTIDEYSPQDIVVEEPLLDEVEMVSLSFEWISLTKILQT